ncbi:hypothetical protein [Gleimia coleocanis]|uniref:hypothetical protein n=1 Tax=Gleimia coleocanis TaxID=103618 RepID=UPI0002EA98FB|nr:hypothetical protein [Gleimia coleocanis]
MQNRSRLFVTLGVIAAFILSACGVKDIQTTTVDENFKGTRVIEMRLAKKDLKDKLNGTIEQVDQVIKDNLPAGFTFSGISDLDAETHKATFTLTFDSVEDYKTKVNAVLPADRQLNDDSFRFSYNKGSFRKVVLFEEDMEVEDLFNWLPNALVKAGLVKDSDKSQIFDNALEKPKLVVDGTTYESEFGFQYQIDQADPGVDSVTVWVALDSLNKVNSVKVVFEANQDKSDVLDNLTKFVEDNKDIKGKFEEADVKSGILTKTLVLEVKDYKDLNNNLAAIFGAGKAELNVDAKSKTIKGKLDPTAVCEKFCFERFIINTSDLYNLEAGAYSGFDENDENRHNWDVTEPESFEFKVETNLVIDSADVTLDLAANGGVTITREFLFTKEIGDVKVLDDFKKMLTPKGSKAKVTIATEDKFYKVTSVHEGDLETMNDVFTAREDMKLTADYAGGRYLVNFGPGIAGRDEFPKITGDVKIQVNKPFLGSLDTSDSFSKFKSDGSLVVSGEEVRFMPGYTFVFSYGPIVGLIVGAIVTVLLLVAGLIVFLKRKTLFAKKPVTAPVPGMPPVAPAAPGMPGTPMMPNTSVVPAPVMPAAPAMNAPAMPEAPVENTDVPVPSLAMPVADAPVMEAEMPTQVMPVQEPETEVAPTTVVPVTPEVAVAPTREMPAMPAAETPAEQSDWAEDDLI